MKRGQPEISKLETLFHKRQGFPRVSGPGASDRFETGAFFQLLRTDAVVRRFPDLGTIKVIRWVGKGPTISKVRDRANEQYLTKDELYKGG